MEVIKENSKRILVQEIGPYFNMRYVIYEKGPTTPTDVMEVWFSDKDKAIEHWGRVKDKETFREKMERERKELAKRLEHIPYIEEELPFM